MNAYEQKQAARQERLEAAADRARREAGHYSEGRDRRYRDRAHRHMDKACVAQKRSEELDRRAASVGSGGISSDDPDAVAKLRRQFEDLEHRQATYVSTNKMIRKGDREGLAGLGFSETEIAKLFEPDWAGRIGIPDYVMKNNGANIRRLRKRIESLEAKATAPAREPIEAPSRRLSEIRWGN